MNVTEETHTVMKRTQAFTSKVRVRVRVRVEAPPDYMKLREPSGTAFALPAFFICSLGSLSLAHSGSLDSMSQISMQSKIFWSKYHMHTTGLCNSVAYTSLWKSTSTSRIAFTVELPV